MKILKRCRPGEQPHEVVLAAEREYGVDQIVTNARFALLDLQTVSEEVQNLERGTVEPMPGQVIAKLRSKARKCSANRFGQAQTKAVSDDDLDEEMAARCAQWILRPASLVDAEERRSYRACRRERQRSTQERRASL